MTKSFTNLLGIIITILAGTYFYLNYCSECGAKVEEVPTAVMPTTPDPTSYPFAFQDAKYAYDVNDNFNFNVSSSDILMPISSKVGHGIESLKSFLADNPGKSFNITGFYKSDETNNTAFPNLGLARANAVKNYLVSAGISSTQINTFGKLMDSMVPDGNMYKGPIAYSLEGESENLDAELQALFDKINGDPLVLNFETSEFTMELSEAQRNKFADISRYLDKVPGATCMVVGHTDSTAKDITNMRLGQERADFARDYLEHQGIDRSKIKTVSKGESTPVATNDTEEGRAKNRRAVVTLTK